VRHAGVLPCATAAIPRCGADPASAAQHPGGSVGLDGLERAWSGAPPA